MSWMKWEGLVFAEAVTSHDNIGRKNVACENTEISIGKNFQVIHRVILRNVKMQLF